MEFSKFFLSKVNKNILESDNINSLLSLYNDNCVEEDDFIQFYELKNILEVVNIYYELFNAYKISNDQYASLYDAIENISSRLEGANISCFSYAYYIYVFLLFLKKNDKNFSKINELDEVNWNNPKTFSYYGQAFEKTFGIINSSKSKAYPNDKNFVCKKGVLVEYKGNKPYVIIPDYVKHISKNAFYCNKKIKMIYMPDSIESFDESSFKGCTKLSLVHLSKNISSIPNNCFEGCTCLKYVNGDNIEYINDFAFNKCAQLSSINFDNLKYVGSNSFSDCKSIKDFDFISNLQYIGDFAFSKTGIDNLFINDCSYLGSNAFEGCNSITSITLNNNIEEIGKSPFLNLDNVKELILNLAPSFEIYNLFNSSENIIDEENINSPVYISTLTLCPSLCKNLIKLEKVEVKDKTSIPDSVFYNCKSLNSISFNSPVIYEIEDYSFYNCSSLLTLNMDFKGNEIGESSFYGSSIENYDFLDNVTIFDKKCLSNANLKNFDFYRNRKFDYIGPFAFANSKFPDFVNVSLDSTIIYPGAFHGLNNINTLKAKNLKFSADLFYSIFERTPNDFKQRVKIDKLLTDFEASNSLFSGSNFRYIECNIQNGFVPNKLFDDCENLESVKLNGRVQEFGESCFKNCKKLNYINFEKESNIIVNDKAFYGCENLNIDFFDSISYIGEYAFKSVISSSIILTENVLYIGEGAFSGCNKIEDIVLPFVGTSADSPSAIGIIFNGKKEKGNITQTISEDEKYYFPSSIKSITVLSKNIPGNSFDGSFFNTVKLPNILEINSKHFNNSSVNTLELGKFLESISMQNIYKSVDNLIIDKENENISYENGIILSRDDKILYYYNTDEPFNIKNIDVVKSYSMPSYNKDTLNLENIKLIETNSINLSNVNKLNISNVERIEEDALYYASSLKGLSISYFENIEYDKIFSSIQTKHIDNVSINNILFKNLLDIVPFKNIYNISISNSAINADSFNGITFRTLSFNNVCGNLKIKKPINDLYIYNSDDLLHDIELDDGQTIDKVIINAENIKNKIFSSNIYIDELILDVSNRIYSDSLSNISCGRLIIKNIKLLDPNTISNCKYQIIEFENSEYYVKNGLIFHNEDLYFVRPNKNTFTVPSIVKKINEFSVDLINVSQLIIDNPDLTVELNSFYNSDSLNRITCTSLNIQTLRSAFTSLKHLKRIDYLSDVVAKKFLSNLESVTTINLSSSLETVNDFAFYNDKSLVTICNINLAYYYGDFIFKNCASLKEVELNANAIHIGYDVFENCNNISKVLLPITKNQYLDGIGISDIISSSISPKIEITKGDIPSHYFENYQNDIFINASPISIGEYAFNNCNNLNINFDRTINIGKSAFKDSAIKDLNLPKIEVISDFAFENAKKLNKLTLSNSLKSLSNTAFNDCNLTSINMNDGNDKYRCVNNILLEDNSICLYANMSPLEEIDLTDIEILDVMPYVFSNSTNLVRFTANKIRHISSNAFSQCNKLKYINISNDDLILDKHIFDECNSIESLTLYSIKNNYASSLGDLFSEEVVPNSIKSLTILSSVLNSGELESVNNIEIINISNEVNTIPDKYFSLCNNLSKFNVPDKLEKVGKGAFKDCKNFSICDFKNTTIFEDSAFENTAISSFKFNSNTKYIGKNIFKNAKNLRSLDIDIPLNQFNLSYFGVGYNLESINALNINSLSSDAFKDYIELKNVNIDGKLNEIPRSSFEGCKDLEFIVIPNNVIKIGESAFKNSSLKNISLSNSLKEISKNAFENCIFDSLSIPNIDVIEENAFNNCSIENLMYEGNGNPFNLLMLGIKPDSLKTIVLDNIVMPESFLMGCSNLKSITIKNEINIIQNDAFNGCKSLSEFNICGKISVVKDRAFKDCKSINFNEDFFIGLLEVGENSFDGCNIKKLKVESSTQFLNSSFINNPIEYLECVGSNNYYDIKKIGLEIKNIKTIVLDKINISSSYFEGYENLDNITIRNDQESIPDRAFYNLKKLSSLNINSNIKRVGPEAFYNCKLINFDENFFQNIEIIDHNAFEGCKMPKFLNIPNIKKIGSASFKESLYMNTVILNDNIESIPKECFYNTNISSVLNAKNLKIVEDRAFMNSSLTNTDFMKDLVEIKEYAFKNAPLSNDINLKNIKSIGAYALSNSENLNVVIFSGELKDIPEGLFANTNVTEVILPGNLNTISKFAFQGTNIRDLYIPSSVTYVGECIFKNCKKTIKVSVPSSNVNDWDKNWCTGLMVKRGLFKINPKIKIIWR